MSLPPLYPWQADMVSFARTHPKCWLAADPGMGKSRAAIEIARETAGHLMFVVPPHLVQNWRREFELWWPEAMGDIQFVQKGKDPWERKAITVLSYNFMVAWMKAGVFKNQPAPALAVFDEAHYMKSWTAKRTKAGQKIIEAAPRVLLLTGTPIVNRPAELGPILQALGVFKNKKRFEAIYCGGWQAPWGWDASGNSDPEGLRELLEPLMLRVSRRRLGEVTAGRLPPRVVEFDINLGSREKAFSKAEVVKNPNPIAFEGMSELMKWHGEQKIAPAVAHISDILESEDKVIVFAWHTEVVAALAERLGSVAEVVALTGQTKDKQAAVDQFTAAEGRAVLLANHKAGGTGLNITAASYVVFVEAPWSPGDLDQCISRADRIGQTDVVRTDILTVAGSVDGHVIHALLDKAQTVTEVVEKMEPDTLLEKVDAALAALEAVKAELVGEAEPEPEPEPEQEDEGPEQTENEWTLADIRAVARSYIKDEGVDALKEVLESYGAENLSALEIAHYDDFMEAVNGK